MATRADFYVGRSNKAEWLGSIAWDGCPTGIPDEIRGATDESDYRAAVASFIAGRKDGTEPSQGWPWPWDNSATTDYAYAFDDGSVYASCFGCPWFRETEDHAPREPTFPDMSERKSVTMGERSGVIVLGI